MSRARFFCPQALDPALVGTTIDLPESVAHHAARVVRLKRGDAITLFDGTAGEYGAVLTTVDKRGARARLEAFVPVERESPLAVSLIQGIAATEAMDYAVRKAVELGVAAIEPVITERSAPFPAGERGERRVEHWTQIAVAACEQSGRNRVPIVASPRPLAAWTRASEELALVFVPEGGIGLNALSPPAERRCALLIGPEGGFAASELKMLQAHGATPIALGPRVLRTETAAVAALAVVQARWGDLA